MSRNFSSITVSYSTGLVNGSDKVGGLVGYNFRGDVIACFWDIETSGLPKKVVSSSFVGNGTLNLFTQNLDFLIKISIVYLIRY